MPAPSKSTSSFTLRHYCRGDFEELWRIDQECFEPGISYSKRELMSYIGRPRAFTIVGEVNGSIVGFVVGDRDRRDRGHIITIDVRSSARRTGLGSALLEAAEERLRAAGAQLVFLETAVDNTAALGFYERNGYRVVSTIPRYYLDSVDALVMAKKLKD